VNISAEQITKALKSPLAQAWLVTGEEQLRVNESVDHIRQAARADGFVGREVFFVERGFDWQGLLEELNSPSLFADKRIIEIKLSQAKPGVEGSKTLISALKQLGPDVLLLVQAGKIEWADRKSAWVSAFSESGIWVDVEALTIDQMPAFISARMKKAGLRTDEEVINLLVERCEGNLVAAHQEIELLALLYGNEAVNSEQVSSTIATSARYDLFTLSDALLRADTARVVRIIEGLRLEGEDAILVLWTLLEEIRSVLQVSSGSNARRLFRGGYKRKDQLIAVSQKMSKRLAFDFLKRTGRIDGMIKGVIDQDPWAELLKVACEFCQAQRPVGVRSSSLARS
jgi:DNA polymerase-3 subunit delta